MSEDLHELCCALVEEFYGEFHAQIFSHLTYYGRLSATQLAQRSRLPLKQVRTGLAALTQSRLVFHHTASEGSSTYQANTNSTYQLIRAGKLIQLVRDDLGNDAAVVISEALQVGFATFDELETRSMQALTKSCPALSDIENRVKEAIKMLKEAGYLIHLRSAHMQTTHDTRKDAEMYLKSIGFVPAQKGKKGVLELEERVETEMNRWTNPKVAEYGFCTESPSKKRNHGCEDERSSKRRKTNGERPAAVNGHSRIDRTETNPDRSILLSTSFDNLVSKIRNDYIANIAEKSLGVLFGDVLEHALLQVPTTAEHFRNEPDVMLDLRELQQQLNESIENKNLGYHQNCHMQANGTHLNGNIAGNPVGFSYYEVDRSMAQLATSKFHFLKGAYGKGWKISKSDLDHFVRQSEIQRLMSDRLGQPALRIVRMMIEKGKLDEKQLQETGLLSAKNLRQSRADLEQAGYIDLQEVPREAQRQPNRTIYLSFHDSFRVQKLLLNRLYKAMTRLLQLLKKCRRKLLSTLEKIERHDIQGQEEQNISPAEVTELRRWQRTEKWMYGELSRLDESIALLRDL